MAQETDKYSNPRFDNRIYSLSGLEATSPGTGVSTGDLERGYMIQEKGLAKVQYSLRFLYNPSLVQVQHQTDAANSSSITPQNYRNPLDKGDWNIPLAASVAFNLLFDRTYELWNAGANNPNPNDMTAGPSLTGVWADVAALYRMVGIIQGAAQQVPQLTPDRPPPALPVPNDNPTMIYNGSLGPMPLTPIQVFFGGKNSLTYKGYVNSLDVQYTHFSQLMVPMRCTIGVSMNLMTKNSWESSYDGVESEGSGTGE